MDPAATRHAKPTQTSPTQLLPPPTMAPPRAVPWTPPPPEVAGQLVPLWRLAFTLGWIALVCGLAAVWVTSRVIGLSTWWLGADAEPRLLFVQLLPFYGPLLVTIAALSNARYLPYAGIVASLTVAAVGIGDLGRVKWIAVVELVLAASGLCISVASLAGMYRRRRPTVS